MEHIKGTEIVEWTKKRIKDFYPIPNTTLIWVGELCMPPVWISSGQNEELDSQISKTIQLKKSYVMCIHIYVYICTYILYVHEYIFYSLLYKIQKIIRHILFLRLMMHLGTPLTSVRLRTIVGTYVSIMISNHCNIFSSSFTYFALAMKI